MLGYSSLKVTLAAGVLLLTLVMTVLAAMYPTFPLDELGLAWVQGMRADWLDATSLFFNETGELPVAVIPAAAVVLTLLALRRPAATLVLTISLLALLGGDLLKDLINRPRPDHVLLVPPPESLAFPSGHSAYAMVLCGFCFCVVGNLAAPVPLKRILQGALMIVILAMGASRVYLGVHWPSDVVGGYLWGMTVLIVVAILWKGVTKLLAGGHGHRDPP